MDAKLKNLLEKINMPLLMCNDFKESKINRIVVYEEKNTTYVYIENPINFRFEVINTFGNLLKEYSNGINYKIIVNAKEEDLSLIEEYYKQILILSNNNHLYVDMFGDRLKKENDKFYIEIYNTHERMILLKKLDFINDTFKEYGFSIELNFLLNKDVSKEIKKDISKEYDTSKIKVPVTKEITPTKQNKYKYNNPNKTEVFNKEGVIFGKKPKGKPTALRDISYEVDNIFVSVKVFGIVPSNKKGFNSLTLKVTDFTTSMYVRIYCNSEKMYEHLLDVIKEDMYLNISGYVKNNNYYNDFIINARNIEILDKKDEIPMDNAKEKRIELHTHTTMSQMDGLTDVSNLIKRAIKWGHKAIAITDHNAIQTFPTAAKFKNDIKVIFGVELAMVDDDLDLVFRGNDSVLIDNTYVVFDFETTGFNAGGGDSIIEVGAVKLKNGEIIEKYDRLINPGIKLSEKITELTNITDDMLKDCPNEETVIKDFIAWVGDLPMVAHNAKFDASFLEMAYQKYNLGEYKNTLIDTLQLSRALDPSNARHSLAALVKRYEIPWDETSHHRGDYDAQGTALIFHKMIKRLETKKIFKISEINLLVDKKDIYKFGDIYHINILVKNLKGLKNLFKIISYSTTKYLYKTPRILRSEIESLRDGLLISSSCANGEIFKLARSKSEEELANLVDFYDYIEVQPPEVYSHLLDLGDFRNEAELLDNIKKIIRVSKQRNKLVCATSDVHHLDRSDKIYREIIVNQKVPGGGRHPLNRKGIKNIPSMHFRTTEEMFKDFSFLNEKLQKEIILDNPNKIADKIEEFDVIPDTKGVPFSPKFENSKQEIRDIVYQKAHEIYGENIHEKIIERLESELKGIIDGGFDSIYLIAQKLVHKSNGDGYFVGSRGSVGSSLVATMLSISEVNPLPAHYVCPKCHKTIFEDENGESFSKKYASGYDLPNKTCDCGTKMIKDGQDMPFATFLGFNADKVPDIDLNFSGDYQPRAHDYTKELFGEDHVFRAGTIGTVAAKTAFGFVKGYYEDKDIEIKSLEAERLSLGVTGVKRTSGQHPGGIVVVPDYKDIFDFTPYQYPADDNSSSWYTTHFNYHDIEDCLLKLDILGHDNPTIFKMLQDLTGIDPNSVPMDDKQVMSLFASPEALGVTEEQINCNLGCLGLPEFTRFVMGIVNETHPTTFAELVKISGLSHGTDVWNDNAQSLVQNEICPFKETIGCRDDIMVYLNNNGLEPIDAFKIMELVRKGKQKKQKDKWDAYKKILKEKNIPNWYIDSCDKIKYMFPKAHATAYVSAAWKIAWFKINKAIEYYATYFSIKCFQFDLDTMEQGYDKIKEKIKELSANKYSLTNKDKDVLGTLEIALEMVARGYKFKTIDLNKSDSKYFIIDEDQKTLIPPFRALDGLGDTAAEALVKARESKEFISIEDVQKRGKVSSTIIDKMRFMGVFKGLPESSQLSLFDNL